MKLTDYIDRDKIYHALAGLLIGLAVSFWKGVPLGFAIACFAGICKEVGDKHCWKGTPDVDDAFATAIGGALGTIIIELIIYAF